VPVDVMLVAPLEKLTLVLPEKTFELFNPAVFVFRSKFGADVSTAVVNVGPVEKSRKKYARPLPSEPTEIVNVFRFE
jgi:hypothetical protein